MRKINVRKRGKVYEYFFEGARGLEFQNLDLEQKLKHI